MNHKRINHLDGIRGLAIGAVLMNHLHEYGALLKGHHFFFAESPSVQRFLSFLWVGVDLFYVLSGFLICTVVLRAPAWEPLTFLQHRVRRIVPGYYVSMLFCLLLLERQLLGSLQGWSNIGLHLLFLHSMQEWSLFAINGPYWTLGIEWSFYLLMLATGFLWRTRYRWWLVALMLIAAWVWKSAVFHGVPGNQRFFYAVQLPGALDEFALGCAVALLHHSGKLEWLRTSRLWRCVFLTGATALFICVMGYLVRMTEAFWLNPYTTIFAKTLLCLAFALFLTARSTAPAFSWQFSPLAALGKISYSVYLYHVPAFLLAHKMWPGQSLGVWAVSALTLTMLLSVASYQWIEKRWTAAR